MMSLRHLALGVSLLLTSVTYDATYSLELVRGDVQVLTRAARKCAATAEVLKPGDMIRTGEGYAVILTGRCRYEVYPHSEVVLRRSSQTGWLDWLRVLSGRPRQRRWLPVIAVRG